MLISTGSPAQAQGFYFSEPVVAEAAGELLRQRTIKPEHEGGEHPPSQHPRSCRPEDKGVRQVRRCLIGAIGIAVCFAVAPARAAVTETDVLVAGRALGFIGNLGGGNTEVGIVYLPGDAQSEQQAHEFAAALGDGLRVGNLILKPVLVPISAGR